MKEKTLITFFGGATSYLFGGWTNLLETLALLMFVDLITGSIVGLKKGKFSPKIMFWGITKKIFIFVAIAIAYKVGMLLGVASSLRDGVTLAYLVYEGSSLVKNYGLLGFYLPNKLKEGFAILGQKGVSKRGS